MACGQSGGASTGSAAGTLPPRMSLTPGRVGLHGESGAGREAEPPARGSQGAGRLHIRAGLTHPPPFPGQQTTKKR